MKQVLLTEEEIKVIINLFAQLLLNTATTDPQVAINNAQNVMAIGVKLNQAKEAQPVLNVEKNHTQQQQSQPKQNCK